MTYSQRNEGTVEIRHDYSVILTAKISSSELKQLLASAALFHSQMPHSRIRFQLEISQITHHNRILRNFQRNVNKNVPKPVDVDEHEFQEQVLTL